MIPSSYNTSFSPPRQTAIIYHTTEVDKATGRSSKEWHIQWKYSAPQFQILGYCLWRDIKTNQQMILCCEFFMFRQQDNSPNNHSCQNYSWKPVFVLLQDFGRRQLWGFLDEGKIGKPQNFVEWLTLFCSCLLKTFALIVRLKSYYNFTNPVFVISSK